MKTLLDKPSRLVILAIALGLGVLFIAVLTLVLPPPSVAAVVLLDHNAVMAPNSPFIYPFTIQNLMHLIFFVGVGEIWCRWRIALREQAIIDEHLLPEDYKVVLQRQDLSPIRTKVAGRHDGEHGFLPSLIDLCILQFQASRSVDQTVSVLNSSLELISHRVDLRYSLLRYVVWVIPTIGFIGTVVGIALAMGQIKGGVGAEQDLAPIALALGMAFYTTLVALVQSAILVLLLALVQAQEELAVNRAGQYTLNNLINRLYAGGP